MEQTNLDIYGHAPLEWARAERQLAEAANRQVTYFLSTVRPDGRPHVAGVGALWVDARLWFVSGPQTRKSRNLAERAACTFAVNLPDLDLTLEGEAHRVTDEATLQRLVGEYNKSGWPAAVENGAFTAPYSAPSAGPPPWNLYEFTPTTAVGVASAEPHGATRWRFQAARRSV